MSDPTAADRVLDLTEALLRVPSPYGVERALCDQLEARFTKARPHRLARAANSLCILPRPLRAGAPLVMLLGHLDTVPELDTNPVRRADGRIHGLGASDMKAADAVLIDALERAVVEPTTCDVVGVLYSKEEGPFAGNELPVIRDAAPELFAAVDLAVCMEPTDGRIELGCLGTCHARVVFEGRRAHSARPWQGSNAIHAAAPLLTRLAAMQPRRCQFDGLEFIESASATQIDYRGALNVIPDRCTINVNYRFAPGKDEAEVRRDLAAILLDDAIWELTDFCPAGRVCVDNPLVGALRAAAGGPEFAPKQAWTDVGRLSSWGIDAINWGPGATAQAHQAGEWVSIDAITAAVHTLDRWLFAGG